MSTTTEQVGSNDADAMPNPVVPPYFLPYPLARGECKAYNEEQTEELFHKGVLFIA